MKLCLLLLLLLLPIQARDVTKNIRDRLSKIQQTTQKMLPKESIPAPDVSAPAPAPEPMADEVNTRPAVTYGDRVTRLEVTLDYVKRDIEGLQKQNQVLQDILQQMVITMETQTKVSESNKGSSDRSELIINIILGVVGLIMSGGGGYFVWKNKRISFKKKPVADMSATNAG